MNFKFLNKIKILLISLIAAVVLFLSIFLGISSGKQTAQAQVVLQAAQNLSAGFQYFYGDQNRFPTNVEFASQDIMSGYFNNFPGSNFPSARCSQSFVYKRISDTNFQLDFCLPVAASGKNSGWNVINKQE